MTALIVAWTVGSLLLVLALQRVWFQIRLRQARLERDAAERLLDIAEGAAVQYREDAELMAKQAAEEIADLSARCERLTAERDTAISTGQKAATAVLTSLARERAQHALDLAAAYQTRPALTAGRSTPELLPGGEHAYVDGQPAVLLQLDGDPAPGPLDGPLPPGTNGTRRTRTTRAKKATG